MNPYLILQYPYEYIEIALCSRGKVQKSIQESKLNSVQLTIPHIEQLLQEAKTSLKDLSFIAVNTGPGPYNTLRALITTINGFYFIKKTPLINLGALDLLLHEHQEIPSVAVLNAFAQHVFYAFNTPHSKEQGYCSIEHLIEKINRQSERITVVGNGAALYQKELLHEVKHKIVFPTNIPSFNSLQTLAEQAYAHYQQKKFSSYLTPRYLQSPIIAKKV